MSKNKESEAMETCLDYLRKQNRPYSAVDVFNNLHKELGKTAVTRALEQLAQDKKIVEKTYGKQKIYFYDQNSLPEVSDVELQKMDSQIAQLDIRLKDAEQTLKSREAQLSKLSGSLKTSEINDKISLLTKQNQEYTLRLDALTKNKNAIDPKEKEAILRNNENFVKEWRKRKRLATDMLDAILEGYSKPKKVLFEEIGVETDEDLKISLPKAS